MRTLLGDLCKDQEGVVAELLGPDLVVQRVLEIGLRPGSTVRMIRPGIPCILAVNGNRLSFRDARLRVLVETQPRRPTPPIPTMP